MKTLFIGHNRVEIDDASARTTLHDGKQIPAVPHDTDSYRATAERLGYGSQTGRMCGEHELLHTALRTWEDTHFPYDDPDYVAENKRNRQAATDTWITIATVFGVIVIIGLMAWWVG